MKYFRRYAAAALAIISITVITAGMFAVSESARRISLGETQSVMVCGDEARIAQPAEVTDIEPLLNEAIEYFENAKNRIMQLLHGAVSGYRQTFDVLET